MRSTDGVDTLKPSHYTWAMRILQKDNLGFTLIELLITIAIAGIIMALGIPSLRDFITANRLTSNVNSFVGLMNYARSEAIVRNQPVVICPKSATAIACINTQFWAENEIQVFVDTNGNNQRNANEVLLKTIPAFDATGTVFRVNKTAGLAYFTFESLGYTTVMTSIDLYSEGNAAYQFKYGRTLCVSKPGRVRVVSYLGACT